MVGHCRPPGMQHGGDADARAEMLRVGGDGQHRLGRWLERQIVERHLVVEGDIGDLGGQREHDVEVSHGQQVGLAFGESGAHGRTLASGTMPVAATVIGDPHMPAVGTVLGVAAHDGSAAMLDRRHYLQLVEALVSGMARPIC